MEVVGDSFSNMYSPHTMTGRESMALQNKEHLLDVPNNGSLAGSSDAKPMEKQSYLQTNLRPVTVGPVDGTESQTMNEGLTPPSQNPVSDPNCVSMDWDNELQTFNHWLPEVELHCKHAFVVGTTSTNVTNSSPPNQTIHNETAQVEVTGSFLPNQTIHNQMVQSATDDIFEKCPDLIKLVQGDDMEIEEYISKLICGQNPIENESGQFEDVTIQQSDERCQSVEGEGYLRQMHPWSIHHHQNSTLQQYNERTSHDIGVANFGDTPGQTFMPNKNRGEIFIETSNNFGYYRSQNDIPTSYPTTFVGGSSDSQFGISSFDHHVTSGGHRPIDAATINFDDFNRPSYTSGSYQDDGNGALDVQSSEGGERYLDDSNGALDVKSSQEQESYPDDSNGTLDVKSSQEQESYPDDSNGALDVQSSQELESYPDDSNGALDVQSSQGGESYLDGSNGAWSTDIPSSVKDVEDSGDEYEELDCEKVTALSRSAATEVKQPGMTGRRTPLCHSKQKTMLQFLWDCLRNPNYIGTLLHWVSEPDGHFRFEKSKKTEIAALWGQRNPNSEKKELKYEHFARAMRNYYGKGLERVVGKKLQYILHRVN